MFTGTSHGEVSIKCESEDSITVTVHPFGDNEFKESPVCTYHIGPQTLGGITYHNGQTKATACTWKRQPNTGNTVHVSHDGSLCGEGEENAEYTGSFKALAEDEEKEPIDTTITPTF